VVKRQEQAGRKLVVGGGRCARAERVNAWRAKKEREPSGAMTNRETERARERETELGEIITSVCFSERLGCGCMCY
jgi:hypothetical protein